LCAALLLLPVLLRQAELTSLSLVRIRSQTERRR
jgi:hypothetical protein